jgi:hypothetical protein
MYGTSIDLRRVVLSLATSLILYKLFARVILNASSEVNHLILPTNATKIVRYLKVLMKASTAMKKTDHFSTSQA